MHEGPLDRAVVGRVLHPGLPERVAVAVPPADGFPPCFSAQACPALRPFGLRESRPTSELTGENYSPGDAAHRNPMVLPLLTG